ncbi:hypothetical protein EHN06_08945 [Marinobacter sp. NP-4(2019)]|uniref:hypothetical protein n=1 Tax=Marinobacter sp. NP-4(2019) TaxID=2488665 RepID=UPI000FC3D90F|nr:hypothetical protein [Marinobacter sp. NP-4(2019)]AZT83655.1 hypothetical protein EHN06_08945 [Marinobacter sp. NP-4(2019)]
MTEWLSNFFLSKVRAKNAATLLLCIVGVFALWPWLNRLAIDRDIPSDYIFPLAVLGILALSYLLISVSVKGFRILKVFRGKYSRKIEDKKQQEEFREKVRVSLPALNKETLGILKDLGESEQKIDIRHKGVVWLLKENLIKKVLQTSATEFVIKIDQNVKELLCEFEATEFTKVVEETINNLQENQRSFLDLFWSKDVPYGTRDSGKMMPNQVYSAGYVLVDKGLILLSRITEGRNIEETFTLQDEAESYMKSQIYRTPPQRRSLIICPKFVRGSGASGGGAIGNMPRKI